MVLKKSQRDTTIKQKPLPQEVVFVKTPFGALYIQGTQLGVSKISFKSAKKPSMHASENICQAQEELQEYFNGTRTKFSFKVTYEGTPLQKAVWTKLLHVPYHKTISYKELAEKAGYPRAIRAVASAVGRNSLLVRIPCHRVIASDGTLGGFSAGISKKVWLLKHENKKTSK